MDTIDYYWSFRSHYCYLSIDRVMELADEYPLTVRLRPVLPLILRTPEYFSSLPTTGVNRWAYIQQDAERIAARLGIPFGWPDPDPVVMVPGVLQPAAEQPYIHRLTRLAVAAEQCGKGLELTAALARDIFSTDAGWDKPQRLAAAVASVGLQLEELEASIAADTASFDAEIATNAERLAQAGHWGVPTLVLRGEPFFGQDRIVDIKWRLDQAGIRP